MTSRSRGPGKSAPRKRATDKRPVTDRVKFLLDMDLAAPLAEAMDQVMVERAVLDRLTGQLVPDGVNVEIWERQVEGARAALAAAQERLDAAQAAVDAETLIVTVRALSSKRYFDLLAEHPPSEEQVAHAREMAELAGNYEGKTEAQIRQMQINFDPETYPRAIVAECSDLDEDELEAFFDPEGIWTQDDRSELFNRALAVCQRASILRR